MLALLAESAIRRVFCVGTLILLVILLARIASSWFRPPISGIGRSLWDLLYDVTDPVLKPFQKMIPPVQAGGLGLDFAPMALFVILLVLWQVIC